MPISIATNVIAMAVQRNIGKSTDALKQNLVRLSSGLRINSARDDAGNIGVASRLATKVLSLGKVAQNANDGISLAQVADDALVETIGSMQRIRELAVEAMGSSKSSADRQTLQTEVNSMVAEVTRISSQIKFNGMRLLAGSFTAMNFQIGAEAGETLQVTFGGASTNTVGMGIGGNSMTVSNPTKASRTVGLIDTAMDSITAIRATIGAVQNRFSSIANQIQSLSDAYTSARSSIMDANIAKETAEMTRNMIIQQAGISVLSQANLQPQVLLQLIK